MNLSFRLCTEADLEVANEILIAAYGFQTDRKALIRDYYLHIQPDGWWLVLLDGKPVGFGGAVDYGKYSSIGMLSVFPQWQRCGIGTALMEQIIVWCEARSSPTLILEAEEDALSLYTRLGFIAEELTFQMELGTQPPLQSPLNTPLMNGEDLSSIQLFDTRYFGADRSAVLYAHWHHNAGRAFVTHDPLGQVTGYLFARPGMIGPWVASNAQDAEQLLNKALSLPFNHRPTVALPASNKDGLGLLQHYHFRQQGTTRFMRRGAPFPGQRTHIYGQASPALS